MFIREGSRWGWRGREEAVNEPQYARQSAAPPALGLLCLIFPALTRWANFCRAYGAQEGGLKPPLQRKKIRKRVGR